MWKYNESNYPDELYHYGILGMRWGVRRSRSDGYITTRQGAVRAKEAAKKARDESIAADREKGGVTARRASINAKKAAVNARKESLLADKQKNKEILNSKLSEDHKKTAAIRKKSVSEMSNQELRDANTRLNLEKNYKDLTRKKNVGKKALDTFIGVAGTITAVTAAAKVYKSIGEKASNGVFDKIGNWVIKDLKF